MADGEILPSVTSSGADMGRAAMKDDPFSALRQIGRQPAVQRALPAIGLLPVGFALVLVQVIMGIIGRSAPSLNLFAVGMPVALIAGIVLMALALPAIAEGISRVLTAALEHAAGLERG